MNQKLLNKIENGEITIIKPICTKSECFGASSNGKDLKYSLDIYHPDGTIEKDVRAYGRDMSEALKRVTKERRSEVRQNVVINSKKRVKNFWYENSFILVMLTLWSGVSLINNFSDNKMVTIYSIIAAVILAIFSGYIIYNKRKD